VGRSPVALDHLRVCWDEYGENYNCGRCPKCLRTMMSLYLTGTLDRSGTFEHTLDLDRIREIDVYNRLTRYYLLDILGYLELEKREPELQEALREALKSFPVWRTRMRELAREVDDRLFGGAIRRNRHRVRTPYGYPGPEVTGPPAPEPDEK
jgi:hypothetical protein